MLPGTAARAVESLTEDAQIEVETFLPSEIKASEHVFQGHRINEIKGKTVLETRMFPAGTIVVRTSQRLGSLAAALLEPESDDGLQAWNYFDRYLWPQWGRGLLPYPVHKLLKPANLATTAIGQK